jgi:hypothetical protein
MRILVIRLDPVAVDVEVTDAVLRVRLSDGRELSAPIEWFPRLRDATPSARANWQLIGKGTGVHWPDVDEDVSVAGLLRLS